MSEYDNEMRGVLFANRDRTKDSQPQAKGSCQIDGVEYWVSAWTNTSKKGHKYQSLSFQRKDEVDSKGIEQARQAATNDFIDDEVPF